MIQFCSYFSLLEFVSEQSCRPEFITFLLVYTNLALFYSLISPVLSMFTWVSFPLRRQTQMRTKEPWTLKNSQCFTRWCPCVETCTCCSWATVTRRIISLLRSWLSFWGWNRRCGNICIHAYGHVLTLKCRKRILWEILTWGGGQSTGCDRREFWRFYCFLKCF